MNTCKNCKKEIEDNRVYCSLKCRNIFVNTNLRDYTKMHDTIKRKLDESIKAYLDNPNYCKICNKPLSFEDKNKITCSEDCQKAVVIYSNKVRDNTRKTFSETAKQNISNAVQFRLKKLPKYNDYLNNPKFCKECGKQLLYGKRKTTFCSIKCKKLNYINNLTEYQKYYRDCQFDFALTDYPEKFDFSLIEKFGWYKAKNRGDNQNGVSRDHMISIRFGFDNNIDASIIKHPANCNLLRHNDNVSKFTKCSISVEKLIIKINNWDEK